MTTSFLGLTGPQGVLPQHYTTLLIERVRAKDYALRDFLDIFNHRALSLFYRAWQKYRFPFAYEDSGDPPTDAGDARISSRRASTACWAWARAASAAGPSSTTKPCSTLPDTSPTGRGPPWPWKASSTSTSSFPPRSSSSRDSGSTWPKRTARRSLRRGAARANTRNSAREAVIGQRVWDVESKFRIRVGPLSYAEFRRLLPDGDMLRPLCEMARLYAGPHLEFDVQLVLKRREVPRCRLGGDPGRRSRLGWNTWVRHGEFPSRRFRRHLFLESLTMDHISLKVLVNKLNDTCRRSLEAAAGLCLSRTNYNVEVEHWLLKLCEIPDGDLAAIFRRFEIDASRVVRDLTAAIDRLKTGNARAPALSPQIVDLMQRAWLAASIEFTAPAVRSGHLLYALLTDDTLGALGRGVSATLEKISVEALRRELAEITAASGEAREEPAAAGSGGDAGGPQPANRSAPPRRPASTSSPST